jgi:hypothetical protein
MVNQSVSVSLLLIKRAGCGGGVFCRAVVCVLYRAKTKKVREKIDCWVTSNHVFFLTLYLTAVVSLSLCVAHMLAAFDFPVSIVVCPVSFFFSRRANKGFFFSFVAEKKKPVFFFFLCDQTLSAKKKTKKSRSLTTQATQLLLSCWLASVCVRRGVGVCFLHSLCVVAVAALCAHLFIFTAFIHFSFGAFV